MHERLLSPALLHKSHCGPEDYRCRQNQECPADDLYRDSFYGFSAFAVRDAEPPEYEDGGEHLDATVGPKGDERNAACDESRPDGDDSLDDVIADR